MLTHPSPQIGVLFPVRSYIFPTAFGLLCFMIFTAPLRAQTGASVAEQYLFRAANAERAERGLPLLRWDTALFRAAHTHAGVMASHSTISHQFAGEAELTARGLQAGARFGVIAENVAEAQTAVTIHDAWMHSEHHRDNLLDARVDSIGISVVSRQGQLYAVEDFSRAVPQRSIAQQEQAIAELLQAAAPLQIELDPAVARQTCKLDSGFAGSRPPDLVMRFTTTQLDRLPETLTARLASGRFHSASVGACEVHGAKGFSTYSVAVLLFH